MDQNPSGSEKLLAHLGQGCAIPRRSVSQFVDFLRESKYELVDWHCYGQPDPELLTGSLQVKGDQLGPSVQKLLDQRHVRLGLEIFPIGIPWPEWFRVDFRGGGPAGPTG